MQKCAPRRAKGWAKQSLPVLTIIIWCERETLNHSLFFVYAGFIFLANNASFPRQLRVVVLSAKVIGRRTHQGRRGAKKKQTMLSLSLDLIILVIIIIIFRWPAEELAPSVSPTFSIFLCNTQWCTDTSCYSAVSSRSVVFKMNLIRFYLKFYFRTWTLFILCAGWFE